MQEANCPLCFGELEVRDVAPCDECGALPQEIEHTSAYPFCGSSSKRGGSMLASKPLVSTRNGEAPLLATQWRR